MPAKSVWSPWVAMGLEPGTPAIEVHGQLGGDNGSTKPGVVGSQALPASGDFGEVVPVLSTLTMYLNVVIGSPL